MNLSSYLQMPPAPLASNTTQNAVPQGARSGVGSSVSTGLGFDFAQVMAQQIKHLAPHERQTLAADAPKAPEQPEPQTHVQEKRTEENSDRTSDEAQDEEDQQDAQAGRTRHRAKTTQAKVTPLEADALLEELMQGAPLPTPATQAMNLAALTGPAATTATTPAANPNGETAASLASATTLQTIELSPQVRIITDTKQAPSPESLAEFAKSMGLDESAIQNLLGAKQSLDSPLPVPSAAPISAGPSVTNANINGLLANLANTLPDADSAVAAQLAAMNVTIDAPLTTAIPVASGAGLAGAASTLVAPQVAGLTPTDMAAIQQLQITVLPAAVLPANTPALTNNTPNVSTMDMLSLLGTGMDEQDVNALLTRFSEETGSESQNNAEQQTPHDSHEGGAFSSFSQALTRNPAANTTATHAPQAANMGEIYDQLSDKMATEMAARMHKQLSDGEWKMKFALRPSNLGGVEIQLEMKDGKLDAVFRADNPLTRDLLQNSSQRLREALGNFGINAGQVNVGQGGGSNAQNGSGNSGKQSQVRDNSSSQVSGTGSASSATSTRNKANASLLDLYA